MSAKDDTITAPVVPTAKAAVLGPGLAGLDDPAKAVAASLLMPDPIAAMAAGGLSFEQIRRYAIREELLRAARENFDDVMGTAETRYTRDLATLQTSLNEYLQREPGRNPMAIYLDPAKFDAAMALGFAETSAIGRVLARQGLQLDPEGFADSIKLGVIADDTLSRYESRFGIHVYSQHATNHPNVGAGAAASVIIPAPDHAVPWPIAGLSRTEDRAFTNLHEGWHAKDNHFRLQGEVTPGVYDKIEKFDAAVFADDKEDEARHVFVTRHRGEVLADVGALGDMVRAGHDPSVIDKVREWRRISPDDYRHMSVQALDGLKAEIDKMGVDKFRALSDRAAKDRYIDIVEDHSVDERGLKAAATLVQNEKDPAAVAAIAARAKTDPSVARGLAFLDLVGPQAQRAAEVANVLKPGEQAIKDQLDKWDALQILQARAVKDSGRITPVTMVKAYAKLSDELRDAMDAEPDNHLNDLKLSKLQATFIDSVPQLDYLEANKRFGVDIVADEPALERYKPAQKSATRPTAPKSGGG